jgi:cytochrome c-type biogenesis protein CcmH
MRKLVAALLLAGATGAFAQGAELAKPDPQTERRLKGLAEELRCLVCQNQTIADSHAPLALDLRNQIREQIAAGKSDGDIRDYMVTRYGDFVLYRPPFKATTAVLWAGPVILIVVGFGIFAVVVRRCRSAAAADAMPRERRAELAALLEEEPSGSSGPAVTSGDRSSGTR